MLVLSPSSACDICLDQYSSQEKEPASLKCGHSFCRSCIHTLTVRVCPVCREPFNVTTDMRKLHCDYSDAKSAQVAAHERHALQACRSGDTLSIESRIMIIEDWLQAQSPGFQCSLPTVVSLMRLLVEATSQLQLALQTAHSDEETLKQQKELQQMKWTVEKRRFEQENAALREGISRQRDHLAYLEAELSKMRVEERHSAPLPVPVVQDTKPPRRPLPRHAATTLPSPTSPPVSTPPLFSSPPPLSLVPLSANRPTSEHDSSNQSTGQGATLIDTPVSANPPVRPPRPPRVGIQGPRERTSGVVLANSMPPPGAAPSAFMPNVRQQSTPQISHVHMQPAAYDSSRRTSLPPIKRPEPVGAHSFDSSMRKHRYSAQPSSWRPDFFLESSFSSTEDDPQDKSILVPRVSSPVEDSTAAPIPARPPRSPAPAAETPSLSRKRALRRSSKDYSHGP